MKDTETNPLSAFRRVNVEGTLNLPQQAAACGVRRFIFISSIKVNWSIERVLPRVLPILTMTFRRLRIPTACPKWKQSKACASWPLILAWMWSLSGRYWSMGRALKPIFLNMMRWFDRGVPLSFGAIRNKRSLVALDNLVNLIMI
jgi:UDP-glucose 4-epimerase